MRLILPVFSIISILLTTAAHTQPADIEDFFEQFTADWVRANPNQAISTSFFTGEEQQLLSQQLTPLTPEYRAERISRAREGLAILDTFDPDSLTQTQRISAEAMRWQLQMLVEGEPFNDFDFPLQQMSGANVGLVNQLTVVHPLRSVSDAQNYIARLQQMDDRMNEAVAEARRIAELGAVPPAFILRATLNQLERFIAGSPEENPLTTTLFQKTENVSGLSTARRQQLAQQAAEIVENEVYPAWQRAISVLQAQLIRATDDAGLWRFPNGEEIYAYHLKRFTTTNLTADQIHEIGLREVAAIESQMDVLLRQIGYTEGTVRERVEALKEAMAYPVNDEGRAAIMADIDTYMRDAERRLVDLFDNRPRSPVIAQPYPEFRWDNAAASYTAPPLDGSRPGVFQMPLRPNRLTGFALRTLVYHETVPGHHYQIALSGEDPDLPRFMQIRAFGGSSASSEGWALYAEQLAVEDGWYEGDVEGLIGQLDAALFRARRLVVDTGLHAMGWTRQQAIDFGIEASEIERYVVMPGQACSYMIGKLRILELREKARIALGDRFSITDYHNVVLGLGVVPLTILEDAVDRYIAEVSSRS
tara:strand:- start:2740 stop:4509 length:1770 start_codon:yes stop_codon:yes gene_type:complete